MKRIVAFAIFTTLAAAAQSSQPSGNKAAQATHTTQQHTNDGQRVFEQNCSRCHNPPDGFSPHISSTVVRHMRVRANLSEADMKAIEKFFHP